MESYKPETTDKNANFWKRAKEGSQKGWELLTGQERIKPISKEALSEFTRALIDLMPVVVLFNGLEIRASMTDSSLNHELMVGGIITQGSITLHFCKEDFQGFLPQSNDIMSLLVNGEYKDLIVTSATNHLDSGYSDFIVTVESENNV